MCPQPGSVWFVIRMSPLLSRLDSVRSRSIAARPVVFAQVIEPLAPFRGVEVEQSASHEVVELDGVGIAWPSFEIDEAILEEIWQNSGGAFVEVCARHILVATEQGPHIRLGRRGILCRGDSRGGWPWVPFP